MANSGWVRIKAPQAVSVQVGVNSGSVHGSPASLTVAGGGNIFSAWIKSGNEDLDTIFYCVNHSWTEVMLEFKWLASDGTPGNTTPIIIGANQTRHVPASVESGL